MAIQLARGFTFKEFPSYGEFKHYHQSVEDSSHYEIIQGNQCLYFDFDGEINISELTKAIVKRFENNKIIINVYSSSDRTKSSYHVVVKGVYFRDHKACGQVAKEVISSICVPRSSAEEWIKSFDASVYSAKRNLRLLGSRKIDSTRVKIFAGTAYKSEDFPFPENHESDQLYMSMVSCVGGCHLVEVATVKEASRSIIDIDLTPTEANIAFTLISELLPGVFSRRETKGKSLFLKREKSAKCPICERVHDSDNGVVSLRSNRYGDTVAPAYHFVCMRDPSNSLLLQEDIEIFLPIVGEIPATPTKSEIELFAEKMVRKYGFGS